MIELEFTLADCDRITEGLEMFTKSDRDRIDAVLDEQECYWTRSELREYEDWLERMYTRMDDALDSFVV